MGAAMANLASLRLGSNQYDQKVDPSIDGPTKTKGKSIGKLAAEGKISTKTIERAIVVKKADPELFKAVQDGTVSVNKAMRAMAGGPCLGLSAPCAPSKECFRIRLAETGGLPIGYGRRPRSNRCIGRSIYPLPVWYLLKDRGRVGSPGTELEFAL